MKMIIMCGLPGSGKSTLAKLLLEQALADGQTATICSTDDFMMVDGKYCWEPKKLGWAHRSCEEKALNACRDKVDLVIVDNTNLFNRSRKRYLKIAAENGYESEIKIVGTFDIDFVKLCAARNAHQVPLESIERMARKVQLPRMESANGV